MASSKPRANQDAAISALQAGTVIPAHPLALSSARKLDERRQRALSRYYIAAGTGGLAVGVHTTQFAIHDPKIGLLEPVLTLAAEEMNRADTSRSTPLIRVAGICGDTAHATREAEVARELGYQFGLVSLAAFPNASIPQLLRHYRKVADTIDIFGFYLQPKASGIELPYDFWRGFCEIESARAIKIAPFDRYRTLTVLRAVAESGRDDIALYTGNDDNILIDLATPFQFVFGERYVDREIVGGLLGQWAVWTSVAVQLHQRCRESTRRRLEIPLYILQLNNELTDANAAIFDAENNFRGCIPGIHEVLRRQGLLEGIWCLDESETLSPGQSEEIDRVSRAYPHLTDNDFVKQHLDNWLA